MAAVPIVLVLAVLGSGWSKEFPDAGDDLSSPEAITLESPEGVGLAPFYVLGSALLLYFGFRLLKNRAWRAAPIVLAAGILFAVLGLFRGGIELGGSGLVTASESSRDAVVEVTQAGVPGIGVILLLGGLAAIGGVGAMVMQRRHRVAPDKGSDDGLASALVGLTDDLDRAQGSPLENIIVTYASLERLLAARGDERSPAETTAEFSARVLTRLGAGSRDCRDLADLYQAVGFSERVATIGDQSTAAALLIGIAKDLTATDEPARTTNDR